MIDLELMDIASAMRHLPTRARQLWFASVLLGLGMCPVALPITTALSASTGSFYDTFTDPAVTEILVTMENFQLSADAWSVYNESNPYLLERDLLIRSNIEPVGELDFQFLSGKVLIGENVTLTFQNLALRNIRRLGGFGLDFFMGQDNATIILDDVVRVSLVCNPVEDALRAASTYSAFPPWPPNKVSVRDNFCIPSADGQQSCYQDSLHFEIFTFKVTASDPEVGYSGSYVLHMRNTTRVCLNYVSQQCLEENGVDFCTANLLDQLFNGTDASEFWTTGRIAGLATGGACVVLLIAACWYFRLAVLRYLVGCCGKSSSDKDSSDSGKDPEPDPATTTLLPSGSGGLVATSSASAKETVRLGVLLGSGSFGRVYRGRWHGTDVAVKIISCTADELPKVLKEAEVMMQLNHPNIVRAFQCSVFNPSMSRKALQASKRSGKHASQTSQPHTSSTSNRLSSSTHHPTTSSTRTGTQSGPALDSVVINIMPDIVQRPQQQTAGGVSAPDSKSSQAGTSSLSNVISSHSPRHHGHEEGGTAATPGSGSSSSSEAARRLFSKVLQPLQQHQQLYRQQTAGSSGQGPSTASYSHEGYLRRVTTPVSSSAMTAVGSGSMYRRFFFAPQLTAGSSGEAGSCSTLPAIAVSHHSAPLLTTLAPVVGSWQQGSGAVAPGHDDICSSAVASTAAASSPAGPAVSVELTPLATFTAQGLSSSQPHGSGPTALGEGRDATASARELLSGPHTRSSGSRAGTISSSSLTGTAGSGAAARSRQSASIGHGSASGEIQPATGWFQRMKQGPAGSGGRQNGSSERKSEPQEERGMVVAERNGDSSSEERRQEVQVWLVLELCTGGTLKDAVTMGKLVTGSKLELAKLLTRLLDAANGMAYLHSRGILHGDLKAGNVLLFNSVHGMYGQLSKISDFGLAATLMDGATHRSTASMGTITHMAPEVLRSGRMSAAADVYSFGIMMWEVYTNKQAHAGMHYGAVVERVVVRGERPTVPTDMPLEYALLMKSCWDADPTKRPTFVQVLQCLELLLDNLTSDSDTRISEGSEERSSSSLQRDSDAEKAQLGAPAIASPAQKQTVAAHAAQQQAGTSSQPSTSAGVLPGLATPSGTSAKTEGSSQVTAAVTELARDPSSASTSSAQLGSSGLRQLSLQQLQDLHRWQKQQQQMLLSSTSSGDALQPRPVAGPKSWIEGFKGKGSGGGLLRTQGSLGSGAGGSGGGSSGPLPMTPQPQQAASVRPLLRSPQATRQAAAERRGGDAGEWSGFVQDL